MEAASSRFRDRKKAIVEFIEADGIAHSLDMATTTKQAFMEKFISTVLEPREMNYKMQFMGPTGTNAVESALKLARKVTGRTTIMSFTNAFHGMTLGSLAITGNVSKRNGAGIPLGHVSRAPFDGYLGEGVDTIDYIEDLILDGSSGIEKPAAFILETIQAEGGVNVADASWLKRLRALARKHDILFIVDDIQVGCGRTGGFFSFEGMDLDPDIITLAKGLGGFGTPIAMNMIKPEHDKHWKPGKHTGTFRGQGLSFVAGRIGLEQFRDDALMTAVKAKGERMRACLDRIAATHSERGFAVRGKGMMQAIDVNDGELAKAVSKHCFEQGLLVGPCGSGGRVLKLIPPLTIPDEQLDRGLAILEAAMKSRLEVTT